MSDVKRKLAAEITRDIIVAGMGQAKSAYLLLPENTTEIANSFSKIYDLVLEKIT